MKTTKRTFISMLLLIASVSIFSTARAGVLVVTDSATTSCSNNGQIFVTVTGGTAPYTYTLTSYYGTTYGPVTQNSPVFSNVPPGDYEVVVSDVNGLNNLLSPAYAGIGATFWAYINEYPAICPATTGSQAVGVYSYSGDSVFTYQWSTGATTDTIQNVPIGAQYQCTVTDVINGCSVVAIDSIGMYQASSITDTFITTVANCTNGTATVIANNGRAPYTYVWSNGQTGANATGLSALYYDVTITDAQGCSAVGETYIQQSINISSQINSIAESCDSSNGSLFVTAVNGTAPFTYIWSSGQTTQQITGLSAGFYEVTITDNNGCLGYDVGTVSQSTPITLTTSSTLTSCSSPTGTATVVASGGTPPYVYVWSSVPAQATATATGLPASYYVVNVTDAAGCTQNQSATVSNNTTLSMYLSETDAMCGGAAGSVSANVSGGNAPYTFLWNNGSTASSITNISQGGSFDCLLTDNAGCQIREYTYVNDQSPVSVSVNVTEASCIYTADGRATAIPSGGLAPYAYQWSDGQTTATDTGLLTGDYAAYVTDANGCPGFTIFELGYASIQPCAASISGTMYNDPMSLCQNSGLASPLQNVWIACLPNGGYQWTTNGSFDFTVPPGTYTLYQAPPVYHSLVCPATPPSITLTAGQASNNNNFFYKPDTVADLAIHCIPVNQPVAGFTQHLTMFVTNLGNIAEAPDVVYLSSTDINFSYSNPQPTTYNPSTGELTWNSAMLSSTGVQTIDMYFNIPASLPQGHILNNSDTVYPIINDVDSFNNFEDVQGLVVASYDPNYMDVTPKGTGSPGYISSNTDTTLQYVVHFQNTGTHAASFVTLKIPVDPNLDITTFQFIGAEPNVSAISADDNRMLTISFNNISLPDSSQSFLGSQGFAAFTFRQARGLASGTQIHENANIYFDYNTPVPTDTTLNTITWPAGIRPLGPGAFSLYPNPAQNQVTLDLSAVNESRIAVKVYDMMGKLVMALPAASMPASKTMSLSIAGLSAGVYSVEVAGNANYVQKLIKTD